MACYSPLKAWRTPELTANGKLGITFDPTKGFRDREIQLPCGQCIGCRLERSRQWAMRCVHEASLYDDNCFITLTYDDQNIPSGNSLCLRDFQLFLKRLRARYGSGIRFFHCGEYGERTCRPHYHALLFNFDFPDKKPWGFSKSGQVITYRSESLEDLWSFGHCLIGSVTFESAAYVARYVLKKVTGDAAAEHYEFVDPETGEVFQRKPEYVTMSRRPGIGRPWFEKFMKDVYPDDFVVLRGRKMKPPRAYDRFLELEDFESFRLRKRERKQSALLRAADNTPERLKVREKVQRAKLGFLRRELEEL